MARSWCSVQKRADSAEGGAERRLGASLAAWLARLVLVLAFPGVTLAQGLTPAQREAVRDWLDAASDERGPIETLDLPSGLTREQSLLVRDQLWEIVRGSRPALTLLELLGPLPEPVDPSSIAPGREMPVETRTLDLRGMSPGATGDDGMAMPFSLVLRENAPPGPRGRALFLCLHGGGASPGAEGPHAWPVNTREWITQTRFAISLYEPEGLYFVPRMADDRLGRWWHRHNQWAFEQVIRCAILHWGVDPERIYLLGISEGGYGTAILAPFMPDLFAGANSMAAGVGLGNPPENLANLPFRTDVGENDTMFDRVGLARAFHERLGELAAEVPSRAAHEFAPQPGRGHGIDYRPGVSWVAGHRRNARPASVRWTSRTLHGQRRSRVEWLGLDAADPATGVRGVVELVATVDRDAGVVRVHATQMIRASEGYQTHATEGEVADHGPLVDGVVRVLIDDALLDLDAPVTVEHGGVTMTFRPSRCAAVLLATMLDRMDPGAAAPVEIILAPKPGRADP